MRGTNCDICAIINLGDGAVIHNGGHHRTIEGHIVSLTTGCTKGHRQGCRIGIDLQAVGIQIHTVFYPGCGVIHKGITQESNTHGTAFIGRLGAIATCCCFGLPAAVALIFALRFIGIAGYTGRYKVTSQIHHMSCVISCDLNILVCSFCLNCTVLVNRCPFLDSGIRTLVHNQYRNRTSRGFLLPFGTGGRPGIDQVIVQPQVTIEVSRGCSDKLTDPILNRVKLQPPGFIFKVFFGEIDIVISHIADVFVLNRFTGAVFTLYQRSSNESGIRVIVVIIRLTSIRQKRRDQIRTPEATGVDLIQGLCINSEIATSIHNGICVYVSLGLAVVITGCKSSRYTFLSGETGVISSCCAVIDSFGVCRQAWP